MTDLLGDEGLLDLRRRAKSTDPGAVIEEERARRDTMRARPGDLAVPAAASAAPAGVCAVCKSRPARDACTNCGQPTCAADLWIMLRLCRACASQRDVERGQRGARPEATNWLAGGREGGRTP